MRFETRYDRWLVICLLLAALGSMVGLPFSLWPNTHGPGRFVVLLPALVWAAVLSATLPQFYEVRDTGLFIRQGWRKIFIPWPSLVQMQSMDDSRSAGVFSTQRILVVTQEDRRYLIAVAREPEFLEAVLERCPQLERRAFGLGVPLSPPAWS